MNELTRGVLRWGLAIAALVAVVVFSIPVLLDSLANSVQFNDEGSALGAPEAADPTASPSANPAAAIPQGPVTAGMEEPVADFFVAADAVQDRAGETLVLGPAGTDAVILDFELIPGTPSCVASAEVSLAVESADTTTELGLYPSGLFNANDLSEGSPLPGAARLVEQPAALQLTDGSPGRLRWDVTDLYQQWASGQEFSGGEGAPVGSDFVVAIAGTSGADPARRVEFTSSDAGSEGPTLTWTGRPGCG